MRKSLFLFATAALVHPSASPQSQQASGAGGEKPAVRQYDVASIRINHSSSGNQHIGSPFPWLSAQNVTLRVLIQFAYRMPERTRLLSGGPPWMDTVHFDIQAKMDDEASAALANRSKEERDAASVVPLQNLLSDRFQLKIHHEERVMPIYALVAAKGGLKAKLSDAGSDRGKLVAPDLRSQLSGFIGVPGIRLIGKDHVVAVRVTFDQLARFLTGGAYGEIDRPVVNKTDLPGEYDFELQWARGLNSEDSSAPALFTAIQEQLGLRLEPQKGPVEVTVVDHAELPTEN